MATTSSLDDILNCAVDENAISALVGSLESQLASPTSKAPAHQSSTSSVPHNNVIGRPSAVASGTQLRLVGEVGAADARPSIDTDHAVPPVPVSEVSKYVPSQGQSAVAAGINTPNANGNNEPESQLLGVNSVLNSPATVIEPTSGSTNGNHSSNANAITVGGVITTGSVLGTFQTECNPVTLSEVFVTAGSTISAGTPSASHVKVAGIAHSLSNTQGPVSNSAIYNLASVASAQAPIQVTKVVSDAHMVTPISTVEHPQQVTSTQDVKPRQQVLVNVVNAPNSAVQQVHRPQFVLKNEKTNIHPQHSGVRFVTPNPHPVASSSNPVQIVPQNVTFQANTVNSVTTSVVTITHSAAPQTVTVLRAPASATGTSQATQQIQILNMNNASVPRVTTSSIQQKPLAPRVITPAPIRIAQQQPQMMSARTPSVISLSYYQSMKLTS